MATWHSWLSLMKQAVALLRWRPRSCATPTCPPAPHPTPLAACCGQPVECSLTSHGNGGTSSTPLTRFNIDHCTRRCFALSIHHSGGKTVTRPLNVRGFRQRKDKGDDGTENSDVTILGRTPV